MFSYSRMRIARESLKLKALHVLEAAAWDVGKVRVAPSPGLRLALAYLYAVSDADRALYDGFWKAVIDRPCEGREAIDAGASVNPPIHAIYRAAGIRRTPDTMFPEVRRKRKEPSP
jgi:hypothetical protein